MIHDEHIETMRDNYDDHGAELAAKDTEIERLRDTVAEYSNRLTGEALPEIERLREKALLYDLDKVGIEGREQAAVELVELRAEVARLRGLLREAYTNFVGTLTEAEWEKRVREALGE